MKAHFRLFSMCSAGPDIGNYKFESWALLEHIGFYLKSLRLYLGDLPLRVSISDLAPQDPYRRKIWSTVADKLQQKTGHLTVELTETPREAKGYYKQIRFHIYATSPAGEGVELADGGDTDWTQRLLGNMKERLFISGIGTERIVSLRKTG